MACFEIIAKRSRKIFKLGNRNHVEDDLETPEQYKERWRSVYIIYFTMFLIYLGFSIIVTGVWPYLNKLDPTAGKEFMGFVVAANPFAQMIFSLLVGWWSNKLGSIRIPLIVSLIVFTVANAMYSSLELFPSYRKHWMLWSRFLDGVSSANIAACRSYISAATRYSERTQAVSMISLAQILGFIVGPAVQSMVVSLGDDGVWLIPDKLKLNMYTASGWIVVVLSLFNIYLFFPSVFQEHKIASREAMLKKGKTDEKQMWKEEEINYLSAWSMIVTFFIIVFIFMLLETLGTPVFLDQFAWSKAESLWYMGILMSVGAILSVGTFSAIPILSRKFSEVNIMIWGGFLFMVLGGISFIPFTGEPPKMYNADLKLNLTLYCDRILRNRSNSFDIHILNQTLQEYDGRWLDVNQTNVTVIKYMTMNCGEDLLGCPSNQEWCNYVPQITVTQFVIGFFLTTLGYAIGATLIQAIFSKLLGSKPQGVWMGLMTVAGCLSRVLGPIFVTHVYEKYGTIWTFGITTVMMIICMLWLLVFQRILLTDESKTQNQGEEQELKEGANLTTVILGDTVDMMEKDNEDENEIKS